MRRLATTLLALALALVTAVPAGAKGPPDGKGPKDPEPAVGMTCAEAEGPMSTFDYVPVEWLNDKTFRVEIGRRQNACVDVISVFGDWMVEVDLGGADEIRLGIQDSVAPGDSCWGGHHGHPVTESGTFTVPAIPASVLDACDDSPADTGDDWADGDPQLAFLASDVAGLSRGETPVTITVTLP